MFLHKNPSEHIVMILDNARINHAKLLKPFLKKNNPRLTRIFLPLYSSKLNLLELI
ncbi:transposase [Bacillus cereus]